MDEEIPHLSGDTLASLCEFWLEEKKLEEDMSQLFEESWSKYCPMENWDAIASFTEKKLFGTNRQQLSQFWYDEYSAGVLAKELLFEAGSNGRIACISCPTVYRKLTSLIPSTAQAYCLEFDTRFRAIEGFIFYNYTDPLHIPPDMKNSFDVVLADPPFLSEECLSKVAVTIQYLMKEKVILCTGSVMTDTAKRLLGVTPVKFIPRHTNLHNDFCCLTNYRSKLLNTDV